MKKFSFLPLILCASVVLGLGFGCAGRSPATNYYVLDSEQKPVENAPSPKMAVQIRPVNIPNYLDRNSIVTRSPNTVQVTLADYHQWAESLGSGMRRVLAEVLAPRLALQNVSLEPADDHSNGPLQLFVQVLRFDGTFGADAILEVRWTLRTVNDKIAAQGNFMEHQPAGLSYESLVKAQSALLVRLGESLVNPLAHASLKHAQKN
ncbi:MAG: PqiC family protein [Desulfovibrionaceae bacterium]